MSISLGDKVECIITGFTGIATARVEYINGEIEFAVTPQELKDGQEYPSPVYLSSTRLKRIDGGIHVKKSSYKIGFVV